MKSQGHRCDPVSTEQSHELHLLLVDETEAHATLSPVIPRCVMLKMDRAMLIIAGYTLITGEGGRHTGEGGRQIFMSLTHRLCCVSVSL